MAERISDDLVSGILSSRGPRRAERPTSESAPAAPGAASGGGDAAHGPEASRLDPKRARINVYLPRDLYGRVLTASRDARRDHSLPRSQTTVSAIAAGALEPVLDAGPASYEALATGPLDRQLTLTLDPALVERADDYALEASVAGDRRVKVSAVIRFALARRFADDAQRRPVRTLDL